jgi:hypothetical protein
MRVHPVGLKCQTCQKYDTAILCISDHMGAQTKRLMWKSKSKGKSKPKSKSKSRRRSTKRKRTPRTRSMVSTAKLKAYIPSLLEALDTYTFARKPAPAEIHRGVEKWLREDGINIDLGGRMDPRKPNLDLLADTGNRPGLAKAIRAAQRGS